MTRVVAYCRYSSDGQRATSIEDQLRNCQRRAAAEGWEISRVYADAAISGATDLRPEYQEMLAAGKRGGFDVLLIDDLSRLARDIMEQEGLIRSLEFNRARIISVTDGYDSNSGSRKIHRVFKGAMNEMFLDDLAQRVHRGQTGQALKGYWNGGRPYGYRLVAVRDSSQRDAYGEALKVGTRLEIDATQAEIVREIFERRAGGQSCKKIAEDLNARGVPSPGSTWKREVRRCKDWLASSVRVVTRNPLYTGKLRWNACTFKRNPDTKKIERRDRPESEWVVKDLPELRIVTDDVFQRAQRLGAPAQPGDLRLRSGGEPRYVLSGILACHVCGSHYVMANERSYACGGHVGGGKCENKTRLRRDHAQTKILGPIRDALLAPDSIDTMAAQWLQQVADQERALQREAKAKPKLVQELEARRERLRARLVTGDPDMAPDEIQAAIALVEEKLAHASAPAPTAIAAGRQLASVRKAAAEVREEVSKFLEGDELSIARARLLMRRFFGKIPLEPTEDDGLVAHLSMRPEALFLRGRTSGRGERI